MKIVAVYFDRKNKYRNLLNVFLKSAAAKMPDVGIDLIKVCAPQVISRKHDMAHAFNIAAEKAISSKGPVAVCDIDLLFLHSIESAFKLDFDVAVTVRRKYKYNTGLWFMKPTNNARDFVAQWIKHTKYLMENHEIEKNKNYIDKYAGIDQASLAMAIKKNKKAKVLELQCSEWNSCQGEWPEYNNETKVLHVKSALRGIAMRKRTLVPEEKYLIPLAKIWRSYL